MATQTLFQEHYNALNVIVRDWDRRLRLRQTVLWLPRMIVPGLVAGMVLALIARTRPFLTTGEIGLITGVAVAVGVVVGMLTIWLWRRPPIESARRFDLDFRLNERVSTALELGAGKIRSSDEIAARQLEDARVKAGAVSIRERLPLIVKWRDWIVVALLLAALVALLVLPNPQIETLERDAAQSAAVEEAAEDLRDITEDIAADPTLGEEERQALLEQLQTSIETLEQPNVTLEEAFASLSNVESTLRDQAQAMEQSAAASRAALEAAAEALRQAGENAANESQGEAGAAGQTMEQVMEQVTERLEEVAENARQMTEEERQQAAEALRDAAQALQEQNPAAAEQLNEAAESLEQGDQQATEQQLQQAQQSAEQMAQEQQRQEQAAEQMSQQAEQAQQSAEQISEAQQGQQQPGGQEGEQQGQQGEQAGENPGEGEPMQGQQGESQSADPQAEAQEGQQAGAAQAGDAQGDESLGAVQQAINPPGQDNNPDGTGESAYESISVPRRIGGEGGEEIILEPDASDAPVQEGEFAENPEGQVTVPYNEVFGDYRDAANRALDSGYVPLALEDVVRDYFSSLEPE